MEDGAAGRSHEVDAEDPRPELGPVRVSGGAEDAGVRWVPVSTLILSDSPRTAGADSTHTQALAESGAELPPIVVQLGTNRVIDGWHRVGVARLRREHAIRARFFDGDDESAFVLAVRLNARHGLPLTLADRKEAARRILRVHPTWSDRAIASVANLSHKTIAALRSKAGQPALSTRVGRDGRTRPVSTGAGRERARRILEKDTNASLREVSAAAAVSPGTVRVVRDQLRRQAAPVDPELRVATRVPANVPRKAAVRARDSPADPEAVLRVLRADPALRFTQSGRQLLSILAVASMDAEDYDTLIVDLPPHCIDLVAQLAATSVQSWNNLATRLVRRRSMPA